MEAVSHLPLPEFPMKYSSKAIHFSHVLKQGIRNYYQEDPESYNTEIQELENLRNEVNGPVTFLGLTLLKKYYCQLHSLCSRFPLEKVENLTFSWSFGINESSKNGHSGSIIYEMNSVMYNIGSMHMAMGEDEMTNSPNGMKIACTHFQCAAWAFETLSESKLEDFEITPMGMTYFKNLALCQAQECIFQKSMSDNRKSNIIAKVSMQVVEYLKVSQDCLEVAKKQSKNSVLPKVWEALIKFKLVYYHAMAIYHLGMQSEEQEKVGEKIAYFEAAAEKLSDAAKCTKQLEKYNSVWKTKIRDALTFANDVIKGKLTAAKKENEFVFHDKVPPISTLPEPKGASLVKCISFSFTDPDVAGEDIFKRLVPIEAHQASSVYSEEKAKLLRRVASEIEEKNVELESYLSSMQLDSFAYQNDETLNAVPQELVECCADLNSRDAYRELSEAMALISNAQHEIDMKIDQIQSVLKHEEEQEKEFNIISGTKQPPNQILNELNREIKRCKTAHDAAQEMNKTLHSAITTHKDNIAKLSSPLDDLLVYLPSAVVVESEGDIEIRQEIQRLMKKVRDMKAQRESFDIQLRRDLQEDDITREVVINQGNTEQLFKTKLEKHSVTVSLLEQNMSAQLNILNALSEANANYAATRRSINQVRSQRSEIIHGLLASYQAFMNIVQKVENAKIFYSKMESQLNKAFGRAKSLCKVQEEQREEKLSVNVKRFTEGYSPAINNRLADKNSSVASGPKLKDFLMAGNEAKILSNPTPPLGSYPQDYSNCSVRPSPVGSEITDNRAMNVPVYGAQTIRGQTPMPQSLQYHQPYSQISPHHIPTPQSISRQGPIPQPNLVQPNRPQSVTYQISGSQSVYKHLPETQSFPGQVSVTRYQTPAAQSTPYNVSAPPAIAYQTPTPHTIPYQTSNPHPTSVSQSIPYYMTGTQPIFQQAQLASSIHSEPPSLPHQIATSQHPSLPHQIATSQHPSYVTRPQIAPIPNSTPQPVFNMIQRPQSVINPIPGSAPTYPGSVASSIPIQTTGSVNYNNSASRSSQYQVIGSGPVPHQTLAHSGIPQTFNSQTYKNPNLPQLQSTLASKTYPTQVAATPTSLQYNYGQYPVSGNPTAGDAVLPSHPAFQNVNLPYPNNVRPPAVNSNDAISRQKSSYPITAYPGQYQQPEAIHQNGATSHQFQGGTNPADYQRVATPQQQYQSSIPYNPGGVVYQASTHQTLPQDSYTQKSLWQFSGMQVVPSAGSFRQTTDKTEAPVSTSVSTGQYSNQRYVPSGFGNYPNWSATNTNSVSCNSMTSSVCSPNSQPIINPGSPAGINFPDGSTTTKVCTGPPQKNNIPAESAKGTLSNLDLLAGIDISQTTTARPLDNAESHSTSLNDYLPDAVQQDVLKLEISADIRQTDETILAKLAQQPKNSTMTVDPLSVESVLTGLATETERFSKFVLGLDKKSLNGPTNMELKWKELANCMEKKCASLKISVSRCYPLKNRFADVLPFDETRVILPSSRDDYINASHVQLKLIENSIPFIMTQAPMPNTFVDFWSMVWDNQVETVVCLNIEAEAKGHIYYPTVIGAECNYGTFVITLKQSFQAPNDSWIRRTFNVIQRETKATRVVIQFQLLTWPPGEMPESPSQFLQFVEEFHDLQKQQRNKLRPTVIHCISGTGRSGAFVILSAFIQHLNQTGSLFDIWKLIVDLCQERRSALQDKSYLLFLYSAALYYAQDILMKRGILTDKATFEDNPRDKTHVRHPSADLLTSDLSKMRANLGLDTSDSEHNNEPDLYRSSVIPGSVISEKQPTQLESDVKIQIGGTTLPPNLAASVDPQQLTIDDSKKSQKMTKEQFTNPSMSWEDDTIHPFRELDPLWSHRQS